MQELVDVVLNKAGLEEELVKEIVSIGRLKKVEADQFVINSDSTNNEIPIVLSGLLKVMQESPDGLEIFLYFMEEGETCAMSINCCITGSKSSYKVLAEEDSELWMIPRQYTPDWVVKYPSFRKYVFTLYHYRFNELLGSINSVVFTNMDERLYKYLLDAKQATGSFTIHKTHEQIAHELNSSRVVITRLLKKLQLEGKIEIARNKIEIM